MSVEPHAILVSRSSCVVMRTAISDLVVDSSALRESSLVVRETCSRFFSFCHWQLSALTRIALGSLVILGQMTFIIVLHGPS